MSLDSRWNAGLALRFSLPDFKGASYGDGSASSNLYRIVEREKRILYEERVAGPTVSLARGESGNLEENDDSSASIQVRLSEAFEEDVTLNLVGSGSATYGTDNDWSLSVGGTNCAEVPSRANCNVTVAAGETTADVMITVHEDGGGESSETIVLSIMIASQGIPA